MLSSQHNTNPQGNLVPLGGRVITLDPVHPGGSSEMTPTLDVTWPSLPLEPVSEPPSETL